MWPRSKSGVIRYRRWLRQREARLIMDRVVRLFPHLPALNGGRGPRILEFGSGEGHQVPILRRYGTVTASDVYRSPHLRLDDDVPFVVADIAETPFADGSFDLVYSNHVLEHVPRLGLALREIQRIGTPDCVFAFSMPTPLWLFLCLPAKYLDRAKRGCDWMARRTGLVRHRDGAVDEETRSRHGPDAHAPQRRGLARWLLPGGHGEFTDFGQAFRGFRATAWRRRFADAGLRLVEQRNLLIYATARWPFIPANTLLPRVGLTSSRLFVLQPCGNPAAQARRGAPLGAASESEPRSVGSGR